jgi:hypothetical protein
MTEQRLVANLTTFELVPYNVTCAGTDRNHGNADSIVNAHPPLLFLQQAQKRRRVITFEVIY